MAEIRIVLHSDLCAASGESTGNAIDTDIAMDKWGIPYIPARRIKGCLRQSAEELACFGCEQATKEAIEKLFGNSHGQPGLVTVDNAYLPEIESLRAAIRTAAKNPALSAYSTPDHISDIFSYVRGSTAMENGKAVDGTLRFTRVMDHYSKLVSGQETVFICPVNLSDPSGEELLRLCCKATRHIGSNRNRGLGNVTMEYRSGQVKQPKTQGSSFGSSEKTYQISWLIHLDAPVVVPGLENRITAIPSRAVIGCLSASWLKDHTADEPRFARLFLNGETRWMEMTPALDGERTEPVPRILMKRKSGVDGFVNVLARKQQDNDRQGKAKPLEGCYARFRQDGFDLVTTEYSSTYHHSVKAPGRDGELYVEESVDAGCIYGGSVIVPGDLLPDVLDLIKSADFRFGRSKSAQYGACTRIGEPTWKEIIHDEIFTSKGDTVYAVLLSDLVLIKDGLNTIDRTAIRTALTDLLALENRSPLDEAGNEQADNCSYRDLGGYQTMWHLNKPVYQAVHAGSYYCFLSKGEPLPRECRIGEFPQEALGRIRLFSGEEMARMINIRELAPEALSASEDADASPAMLTAIAGLAVNDSIANAALRCANEAGSLRTDVQIGRLRLMLSESTDLKDLRARIESIKTKKYKVSSLELVTKLYGSNDTPDLTVMTGNNETVMALIQSDPILKDRSLKEWKKPLGRVLSLAYY